MPTKSQKNLSCRDPLHWYTDEDVEGGYKNLITITGLTNDYCMLRGRLMDARIEIKKN